MNEHEDDQLSAEELAAQFGEEVPIEKPRGENDIYAVAARIKNLATFAVNSNLTPLGVSLCNAYTHVIKALYDYSDTIPEPHSSILKSLIKSHEGMPGDFIATINNTLIDIKVNNDKARAEFNDLKNKNFRDTLFIEELKKQIDMLKLEYKKVLAEKERLEAKGPVGRLFERVGRIFK